MAIRVCHRFGLSFVSLLLVASSGVSGGAPLLIEAAKNGDKATVVSLLRERVDVNAPSADGTTALAWAAHRDYVDIVELLIGAGAKVNVANDYGMTALALACVNASAAVVKSLLKGGADPNTRLATGETVLMQCARTGSTEAVKALITYGADVNANEREGGQTALMWAVVEGHAEVARLLLEHGADVHARSKGGFTALLFASRAGDESSVEVILNAKADVNHATPEGITPLLIASANGHESLAIQLLKRGADPNAADRDGMTALHYSVLKGISNVGGAQPGLAITSYRFRPNMIELAQTLLAHGADPNARLTRARRMPFGNTPRFSLVGATPFLLAAGASDPKLMQMLIEHGANPLLGTEKNVTPLMVAAGLGRYQDIPEEEKDGALEAVKLARRLGNEITVVGENGYTALHGAAYVGENEIIEYLVENGAELNVKDEFEQTPLSIAKGVIGAGIVDFSKKPFGPHPGAASLLTQLGAAE
jgi:ankyrin repeat protein